ncbi:MAG: glycosyltransferase [Rhodobacteraceae bacterium]|nr:glycosyltransferase [Paracoccaceae bacterium]
MSDMGLREGVIRLAAPAGRGARPVRAVAVVIPVFRHSVLLAEAVESALEQGDGIAVRIVIVNDGCPHRETEAVCRAYAEAWPERIRYVRKPNGGLSDARNAGIRHVLAEVPDADAIYMMDADNRLRPGALARAAAELDAHPQADWIYPNIDMFGLTWAGDYGGDYSLLLHSRMNLCEAGSLIRRRVFEAGVFFDTEFRQGFEDWEFFLQAAERGFRGRNIENFGFLYRKRGESMLAESERDAAVIRGEMERKHRSLFQPRRLVDLEQAEAPRFALYLSDRDEVQVMLDPAKGPVARMTPEEFEACWWRGQMGSSRFHVPPFLVVTRSAVLEALQAAGLAHFALWLLERRLVDCGLAGLVLEQGKADRLGVEVETMPEGSRLRVDMVMARPSLQRDLFRRTAVDGSAETSIGPAGVLRLEVPGAFMPVKRLEGFIAHLRRFLPDVAIASPWSAAKALIALAQRMQRSPYRAAADLRWEWRHPDIGWRARSHEVARIPTGGKAAFPHGTDGRFHVGFLLPLVEFGGVERVALNVAAALKAAGMVPHLFVLDAPEIQFGTEWREVFESVTFLCDPAFATWGPGETLFDGTVISDWARWGDHGDALAMLAWLDAALNFHGGAISGLIGKLRRFGVKTGLSLHLNDLSPFGRPVGNTYLGLAYEHAYDLYLPCSHQLGGWCHAMGVPEEKIVVVPNAPSFALTEPVSRPVRAAGAPLRVIYLGRLDGQKGLDRLIATLRRARVEGVPLRWRLIGKAVTDGGGALPEDIAAMLEPPLHAGEALAKALAEADVFFLPSYFEGLPLTVLEAMRSGVVPIATDVGAVAEVLRDGENGVLLRGEDVVGQAVEALRRLAGDAALLARLSAQAQADMVGRDWAAAVAPLVARLSPR